MTAFFSGFANKLWLAACKRDWQHFNAAAEQVEFQQKKLLMNSLARHAKTLYGQRYGFTNITSVSEYQKAVPLTGYDDYHKEIAAIANGAKCVLTQDKVNLFEPSSGTTSPSKLIPYTSALKKEFQRGINAWLYNLYHHYPTLLGPAYWSISPAKTDLVAKGGTIPVGFAKDSDYLGLLGRFLTSSGQAVPTEVAQIDSIDSFRYVTLLFLLRQPHLRLISVWSPSFLSLLMESLPQYWQSFCSDLACGTISPPFPIEKDLLVSLQHYCTPCAQRAEDVAKCGPHNPEKLWPKLGLISCWHDGPSKQYAEQLQQKYFPGVKLQGKGLLATEAFVTFPVVGQPDCVLAGTSHFFEFIHQGGPEEVPSSRVYLAHELTMGEVYHVVVTTGGGLYRYQMQDLVEVVGFYKELPCLRFIGKANGVSDLFGEKLNPQFVEVQLQQLFANNELDPHFSLVCPRPDLTRYVLFLEDSPNKKISGESLAQQLDKYLSENFHYAYCRKLGQLQEVEVVFTGQGALQKYFAHRQEQGMKLGDIKPCALSKKPLSVKVFQ